MAIGFILTQLFPQISCRRKLFTLSHLQVIRRQVTILNEGSEFAPVRKYWALSCTEPAQTQDDSQKVFRKRKVANYSRFGMVIGMEYANLSLSVAVRMKLKFQLLQCVTPAIANFKSKFNKVVIMLLNSIPSFARASRSAGFLVLVIAMSFLAEGRAAGPTVVSVTPANGASGVSPSAPVVFTFSAAMNTTATAATFLDTNFTTLAATQTWNTGKTILTCTPSPPFPSPDEIIWSLAGQDTSGNALQGDTSGVFIIGGSVSTPCGASPHTNTEFVIEESWLYVQASANPPVLDSTTPYAVLAEASLISNITATAATLTLPDSAVSNLTDITGDGQTFLMSAPETTLTELNATWPNGNYVFKTTGASLPSVTVVLNVAQPNAPQVANFAATQAVDSTKPFMLSWNAFSDRAGTNEIFVNIGYNPCAGTGFSTNLPGTATSVTIPAGALLPASNYVNSTLGFISTTGTTSTSPKYTAGQVKSSVTSFTLTTIGGGGSSSLSLGSPAWSGATVTFPVTASPDKTVTVQYSTTLKAGSWTNLLTTNSGATGIFTVTNTPGKTIPARFYRGYQ